MLELTIPGVQHFDESTNRFLTIGDVTLELEHSLVAISKWESEFETPFLGDSDKTPEQTIGYVRAMTLTPEVDPEVYTRLNNDHVSIISDYIGKKMTATWFIDVAQKRGSSASEVVTSELIYYWMVALTIPLECQHWHLSRLLTLIQVTNLKNQPPKKMTPQEAMRAQHAANQARKQRTGTAG